MTSKSTYKETEVRLQVFEDELADHKSHYGSEQLNRQYLEAILNNTNLCIYLKDAEYRYIFMNRRFEYLLHLNYDQIQGKDDFAIFPKPIAQLFRSQDEEVVKRRALIEFEETLSLPEGVQTFLTSKFPLFDSEGEVSAVGGFCTDVTSHKKIEEELQKAHDELEQRVVDRTAQLNQKTERLIETNVALKILLEKREEDKKELEKKVVFNVEKLIRPYLEKLKMKCDGASQGAFLKIIQSNLDEITSSFTHNNKNYLSNLTPAHIQIVDLIKQGLTTKEIASLLNLSSSTIACHRQEIRKRLSLTNKKTNLRTILTVNS